MGPAVITFSFDPVLRAGGFAVRLETVALAAVLLGAIVLMAGLTIVVRDAATPREAARRLRLDDLLFILVGAVAGAVVGGRLDHVLVHLDAYRAEPATILDPGRGALGLGLGVVGGVVGGSYVARFLDAPIRAWWQVAALPLVFVLAAGKLAWLLGGGGQGAPSPEPWAVAFAGAGPWDSLSPATPSIPSQALEGGAVALLGLLLAGAWSAGAFRRADGGLLFVALAGWAAARGLVASTWRDAAVLGPFGAEQLISLAIVVFALAAVLLLRRRPLDDRRRGSTASGDGPAWPDPASRPGF